MNKKLYDPCPICMQNEVIEFFQDWHPSKPYTEVYTYFCDGCGIIAKKEVNLLVEPKHQDTWVFSRINQ